MPFSVEVILLFILFILLVIAGLLLVIIYRLRKSEKNNFDWSLVYPELADSDYAPAEMSAEVKLDSMLYDPDRNSELVKRNQVVNSETIKLNYAESMSNETVPSGEDVMGSIFSPESVNPEEEFLIAAFLHLPSQKNEVVEAAKMIDDELQKRVEKFLSLKIKNGDEVIFHLKIDNAEIDQPIQKIIWNGMLESVEFGVVVNKDNPKSSLLVKLEILVNSVPAGNMKFKLKISANSLSTMHSVPDSLEAHSYRKAFISYASPDRDEVLVRTQMLAATGISYFQDIMNLKPGELWEKSLFKEIENADVFYLFWSNSAKNSKWVKKEYEYAIDKFNINQKPEIIPIPIEGPPVIEPPEELSHLHFNDGFLYFLNKRKN